MKISDNIFLDLVNKGGLNNLMYFKVKTIFFIISLSFTFPSDYKITWVILLINKVNQIINKIILSLFLVLDIVIYAQNDKIPRYRVLDDPTIIKTSVKARIS